ncbi:MAG: SAM-dependent methyltransferase, partial [Balneolaceae bacterium]
MPGNTLYLIPTPLGKSKENLVLPDHTIRIIHQLDCFIVENVKTATSFLRWINHPLPDFKMTFRVLNKKTPEKEVFSFIRLLQNSDAGMLSEAGAPCVADPGAKLVKMAHDAGYRVSPLTGPS